MRDFTKKLKESLDFLRKHVGEPPSVVVTLSGGIQQFVEQLTDRQTLKNSDIPNFPVGFAEGHKGEIVFARAGGLPVAVCLGRTHYYEGLSMAEITFPLHVLHTFGAKTLLINNSVGGINATYAPGDLMLIRDHINFMGANPLRGVAIHLKPQFADMTNAYPNAMLQMAYAVARDHDLKLQEGVYLATSGPSYETPAEIRAFRSMGADAVGMSVVPEVIVANQHKMQVLGVSCITNQAADLHPGNMNHAEVLKAIQGAEPRIVTLFTGVLERLSKNGNTHTMARGSTTAHGDQTVPSGTVAS